MKNSLLKRSWPHIVLFVSAFTLWSCESIYDDLEGCRIYVDFRYDYNMSGEDKFAAQCDVVELFIFDNNGVLKYRSVESGKALAAPGYRMLVPVEFGQYTAVVWAGHKGSYDLSDATVGTSTLENLTLRMQRNADGTRNEMLESLWHGITTFTYTGDAERTQTIPLVKNTNTVNLTLTNTSTGEGMLPENLLVKIQAANGSHGFDNTLRSDDAITYLPYARSPARSTVTASLSILRLIQGEQVRLSVIDKTTGRSVLPTEDMDMIAHLLQTRPDQMADPEYLDREDTWNIEIGYKGDSTGFIAVVIKINGWVIWQQGTDL